MSDANVLVVDRDQLINILSERAGAAPISFTALTKVRLNKKHRETKATCGLGNVTKLARVTGWVNTSYANAVEKETGEPYVAGETWHDAALDVNDRLTPFAEHPETHVLYLRVVRPKTLDSSYESTVVGHVEHGDVEPYLQPKPKAKPVPFRTYGLDSIVSITIDGQTLIVDHKKESE